MSAAPDRSEAGLRELRRRALWLAELATARPGFVGQYVKKFGPLPESLRVSPRQVAGAFRGKSGQGGESLFGAVLAAGPPSAIERLLKPPEGAADRRTTGGECRPGSSAHDAGRWGGPRGGRLETGVVTCVDEAYPERLRQLGDPPPALFLRGCIDEGLSALRERTVVAVVGSRSPSPYGREMAAALGRDLAAAGVLVVSGMALGIDAVAQQGALDEGAALATVGVLGCGADLEHPPGNRRLFAQVRSRGLLVSEFVWGALPLPWRFPCRNRVLAALAEAVVVVEGGERSGARITARHALELGREVLAVPGEAGRRLAACPHQLLRDGAALCESAQDVFEALRFTSRGVSWANPMAGERPASEGAGAAAGEPALLSSGLASRLLAALDAGRRTPDELARLLQRPVGAVLASLTELELAGYVAIDGDCYRRRRGRH